MSDANPHPGQTQTIRLTKLEAARRQLNTALELWFDDKDPVSIHVLAFSAYDVVHAVSKKRNPRRPDLLFDSDLIKDEFRSEWAILLKTPSGFFKHARNDPEGSIDFPPALSELLMVFAIRGLGACLVPADPIEVAFMIWRGIQNPAFFKDELRKLMVESMPIEEFEQLRRLPKREFLNAFLQGFHATKPTPVETRFC
jgi:hypothetical protein